MSRFSCYRSMRISIPGKATVAFCNFPDYQLQGTGQRHLPAFADQSSRTSVPPLDHNFFFANLDPMGDVLQPPSQ